MFYFVILSAIAAILASPVQELDSSSIDFHTLGSTDNGLFSNFNTDNDSLDRVDSESYVPESDFTASPNDSLIADSFGCNTRKLRARDDIDGETVANELPNACSIHMQRVSPDSVKAPSKEGSGNIEPAGQLEPYKPARLAPTTADSERKCRDESFHLGVCCIGLRGGVLKLEPYKKWYFLQVEGCVAGSYSI